MEFDGGNGDCIDGDAGDGRLVTAIMENGGRDEVVVTSDRANLICKPPIHHSAKIYIKNNLKKSANHPPTNPSTKIYIIFVIVNIFIGIICS